MHVEIRRTRWASMAIACAVLAGCASDDGGSTTTAPNDSGESSTTTTAPPDRRSSPRGEQVAVPTVSGPITGGDHDHPFNAMPSALAQEHGYVEEEYLVAGEATAYAITGEAGTDGRWAAEPADAAPFVTRIVVRRPAAVEAFDGTVVVEWLNVSSGQDSDVEWAHTHDELMAQGTAWVGVSAQVVGIEGGTTMPMPGLAPTPLKTWDPERYEQLSHPGDDFSYDVFSQVGAALLHPGDVDPLGGVPLRAIIAAGESQSAARMVTYINAVHPLADLYDGFLVHSRSSGSAALRSGEPALPTPVHIRDDLAVPVFQVETETDILGLPFLDARQSDSDLLRTWEIAGAAHLDRHLVSYLRTERSAPSAAAEAGDAADPFAAQCGRINEGPQHHVVSMALASLRTWALDGTPPAAGEPIEVSDGVIARDDLGIARGGIRTPAVDAPTVVLRGDNPEHEGYVCGLFGSTTPIDDATLAERYPDGATYVDAVRRSAEGAVDAGHLLEVDADELIAEAQAAAAAW